MAERRPRHVGRTQLQQTLFAPERCRVALMGHGINDVESSRTDVTHKCTCTRLKFFSPSSVPQILAELSGQLGGSSKPPEPHLGTGMTKYSYCNIVFPVFKFYCFVNDCTATTNPRNRKECCWSTLIHV